MCIRDRNPSDDTKDQTDRTEDTKKTKREYPEWKKRPPGKNDPKTKQVQGRTYHWCPYHKFWSAHKPEECKLSTQAATAKSDNKTDNTRNENADKKPTISAGVLQGLARGDDSDSD